MRPTISLLLTGVSLFASACSVTLEQETTTSLPASTTQTTLATLEPLVLAPDGLGAVSFGVDAPTVMADLTSRFGGSDSDTGWVPPEGIYGTCPGLLVRAVGWGSFAALFTDAGADRLPEFFAWTYGFDLATTTGGVDPRGLDLRTEEGIGLGSTATELDAAYGSRLLATSGHAGAGWGFRIDPDDPIGMRGLMSGGEPGSVVTSIESAPACSPEA